MNDPFLMGCFQSFGNLESDGQGFFQWNRAPEITFLQSLPFDQLQNQGPDPFTFFEAVNGADVGMAQRGQQLGFPGKARHALGISGEGFGQDLEGNVSIQAGVGGPIDLSHSPFADLFSNLVVSDLFPIMSSLVSLQPLSPSDQIQVLCVIEVGGPSVVRSDRRMEAAPTLQPFSPQF